MTTAELDALASQVMARLGDALVRALDNDRHIAFLAEMDRLREDDAAAPFDADSEA